MPYVKYIAAGFVQDAQKLLSEFVKENSTEFSVFTHFWKKHNFAAVYLGRSSSELQQFTHEIFQLTLKFLETTDFFHQIGGVYMLYALFRNQVVEPPTRIRVLLKQYQHFKELRGVAIKEKHKALHYVIGYLMKHGFDCVAHSTMVGPRNSKHRLEMEKRSLQMTCVLKELKEKTSSLLDNNLLEELQELNKTYDELTKTIKFQSEFQQVPDLALDKQLKNLAKLVSADKHGNDSGTTTQNETDTIGSRRSRIKSKAFSKKAWFRQLNPTDVDEDVSDERFTRSRSQRKSIFRKAKLPKETEENDEDEGEESEIEPKRKRYRKRRVPKENRRIGRPRKLQHLEEMMTEVGDNSEDNEKKRTRKKRIRRRGPISRGSYLDDYTPEKFICATAEMMPLSSSSEEEIVDKPDDEEEKDELVVDSEEEKVDEDADEEGVLTF